MCSLNLFKMSSSLSVSSQKAAYSADHLAHWSSLSARETFKFSRLTLLVSRDFLHSSKYFSVAAIKAVNLLILFYKAIF